MGPSLCPIQMPVTPKTLWLPRRRQAQSSLTAGSGALTPLLRARIFSSPDIMNERPHVAVVGATGAVGIEIAKTSKNVISRSAATLLASSRSVGKKLKFCWCRGSMVHAVIKGFFRRHGTCPL